MIRGIITTMIEGVIKRFSASGRSDETFDSREYMQHYGFTSLPPTGAEIIIIQEGNNIVAVASDDRRYRLAMGNGEVALYDNRGQHIHLKADGSIHVVATTKVTLDTPLLEVTGDITAGGNITDSERSMAADRAIYNGHTHIDPQGGVVNTPNQEM